MAKINNSISWVSGHGDFKHGFVCDKQGYPSYLVIESFIYKTFSVCKLKLSKAQIGKCVDFVLDEGISVDLENKTCKYMITFNGKKQFNYESSYQEFKSEKEALNHIKHMSKAGGNK